MSSLTYHESTSSPRGHIAMEITPQSPQIGINPLFKGRPGVALPGNMVGTNENMAGTDEHMVALIIEVNYHAECMWQIGHSESGSSGLLLGPVSSGKRKAGLRDICRMI